MNQKSKYLILFLAIFLISILNIKAQQLLKGTVYELDKSKNQVPLTGVTVSWLGTTIAEFTDEIGKFTLKKPKTGNLKLMVQLIGYKTDTLTIGETQTDIDILMLNSTQNLKGVEIVGRLSSSYISRLSTTKTEVITTDGLCRLACCNLAESFENTATVDVGYSDAVSGARQIQMLGLTGVYSQMLIENVPFIKGLSAPFGLNYVPGSFMESIQISKGVASVINGYESVTGQINIEYRKPSTSDLLFVNGYVNSDLKGELNALSAYQINDNLGTMFFAHGSYFNQELDHVGHDHFMDTPKQWQLNLVNRWNYSHKNYSNITLANYVIEERTGGQMGFDRKNRIMDTTGLYGIGINNQRFQLFTKNGIMLSSESSIGLQLTGTYFKQEAFYGLNDYSGNEGNLYANLIYEKAFNSKHKLNAGASFQLNDSKEDYTSLNQYSLIDTTITINEFVPGVFSQYTATFKKILFTAGLRYDYNSMYEQSLITPRIHLKWAPLEHLTFRGVAGKGYRTAYILPENFGLMASSRKFVFSEEPLKMEDAWNYGFNVVKELFMSNNKSIIFTFDFYRTDFINQVVVDLDKSANEVHFYNLTGKSYSNSIQADITTEIIKGLRITLAGRYNDVQMTTNGELQEKVYSSKWKGLLVLSYATKYDKWIFDLTTQLNGPSRLPNTNNARPEYSDTYIYMLGQITRRFKYIDIYAGCENITNYVQKDPIIAAHEPYSRNFDASVVYAPIMTRLFYAGFRWKFNP